MHTRLVLALTALTLPVLLLSQSSDTTPPVLKDFSFDPTTVDVSAGAQTVTFTARVTDDLSAVRGDAWVHLTGPSGQRMSVFLGISGGSPLEALLTGFWTIPRYSQPGVWRIDAQFFDNAGNQNYIPNALLGSMGFPSQLTLTSDPADMSPPTLEDVEIIPGVLDVSTGGQTVTVRYHVKDDLAGTIFLPPPGYQLPTGWGIHMVSPSGQQRQFAWTDAMTLVSGDALDGWWEGSLVLPRYSEAGMWLLEQVTVHDFAANRRDYSRQLLSSLFGTKVQFEVTSSPADTAAPTLMSIDYTPKFINTSEGSHFLTVRIQASDDLSGLLYGPTTPFASFFESGFEFRSPSGQQIRGVCCWGPWTRVAGDDTAGAWEAQVFFPQYSEQGTWKVALVSIKDAVRNFSVFSTTQLEAMSQATDLVVIKPTGGSDGTIPGTGGGTVMDESFGSRAQVTAPPGVLSEPTSVSIDVFPDPIGVPPPTGFQAEGTLFVNIQLIPAPSYPLPAPGLTVVLPLTSARIPGSSLHLFRVNPSTGRLEAAVGVDGNPVIGTVNGPDGLSATFAGIARLSTVVGLVPNAIPVSIDIAPGSSTNPINTKSGGVIPVAVLGSASFHVQTINVTKLWFGPASAKPAHNLSEPLTYASHLQDVNGDGFTDLVLHFPQRDTGLNAGATNACLYGENLQATPVIGCDSVRVLQ